MPGDFPYSSSSQDRNEQERDSHGDHARPSESNRASWVSLGREVGPADLRNSPRLNETNDGRRSTNDENLFNKYSLSSYEHPYDISSPSPAYTEARGYLNNYAAAQDNIKLGGNGTQAESSHTTQARKRQGLLASMMDWYSMTRSGTHELPDQHQNTWGHDSPTANNIYGFSSGVALRKDDSAVSQTSTLDSEFLDPDDPRVTGKEAGQVDDQEDLEKNVLRQMDYRTRRKHIQRIRIEFNISCEFLIYKKS